MSAAAPAASAASAAAPAIPATMTVAEFASKGANLTVRTGVAVPEIGKYDVLVQVDVCGMCHSEAVPQYMSQAYPRTPGHEAIGTVVKVGAEAKRWKIGDRVGRGWHGGHCFACVNCLKGDFIQCTAHMVCGWTDNGGYAEYMVAPWMSLAQVPEGLTSADAAPLMCAGITVFNSLRRQNKIAGSLIGVQGVGGLGHYAIQFASKMGYEVVAITSPDKIEWAKKLGASHVVDTSKFPCDNKAAAGASAADQLKKLGGCALIMCTGLGAPAMSHLYNGLASGGMLLALGVDMKPLEVSSLQMITNRGCIQGWPSGTPADAEDTMNFAVKFGIKSYVTAVPLEQAPEGYAGVMSGKPRFRNAVVTKSGYAKPEKTLPVNATAAAKGADSKSSK